MKKALISIVGVIVIIVAGGYGTIKYKNRIPAQLRAPNYFEYYKNQDQVPEGRVGVFISHLIMPENMQTTDFYTLALKPMQYIPWPVNMMAVADRGVQLIDPDRFYEFEEFEPTRLVDAYGNERDLDGVPYVDKRKTGEIEWVPPRQNFHLDHGYFLLTSRKGGMPTVSAKLINKARHYYYKAGKGSIQGTIPHKAGMKVIVEEAMNRMQAKYGPIPYRWVTAEDFGKARAAMYSLLDEGVDTIILSSPAPVYSHHEEFNGAFRHAMHYIHEWEEANDKHIKVVITPQLGDFEVTQQTWVNMLRDRLDLLPKDSDVLVVMSVHGMPWDLVPNEAWIELSPEYIEGTMAALRKLMESYGFNRADIVQSQDHFADPHNNPDGKYLSTNKAFWNAVDEEYDYAINVPIEFFVENTDTLYSHAMFNFEFFPTYDRYEPIDYPDWSVPYTREFDVEGTTVIYNGVPAGDYNKPIIEAYAQALDAILSKGLQPVVATRTALAE
jgi:protoheme ferro-lyase